MKMKEESEKVVLKLNVQKTKIMASHPIISWQIDRETVETVADFLFWGAPKSLQMVTAALKLKDACSLEGKASSDSRFAFLHFFFLVMVLILVSCTMSQISICSSSVTLSDLVP